MYKPPFEKRLFISFLTRAFFFYTLCKNEKDVPDRWNPLPVFRRIKEVSAVRRQVYTILCIYVKYIINIIIKQTDTRILKRRSHRSDFRLNAINITGNAQQIVFIAIKTGCTFERKTIFIFTIRSGFSSTINTAAEDLVADDVYIITIYNIAYNDIT